MDASHLTQSSTQQEALKFWHRYGDGKEYASYSKLQQSFRKKKQWSM